MLNKERVLSLVRSQNYEQLLLLLDEYNSFSIVEAIEELTIEDLINILINTPKSISADVFANLSDDIKIEMFNSVEKPAIEKLLENLFTDDIIEVLQDLPNSRVNYLLENVDINIQLDIKKLLKYAPETAGSIMTIDYIELLENDSFTVALDKVKRQGRVAEIITDCYVLDDNHLLTGKIKLKDLLFGQAEDHVIDKMETSLISVNVDDDQTDVLELMQKYDLHVIPVVDNNQQIIGIITIDDIIDVMEQEVTHDVHSMAGITKVDGSYVDTSILEMAKARIPWLMIIMVTAFFTELVLDYFSMELALVPVLAAFIPMTMGTSGNAANQATVMVVRGIAVDGLSIKDTLKIFMKESAVSFYLCIIMGLATFIRLIVLPPAILLDIVLSISLSTVISIYIGNVLGGLLPIVALKLKQDPAAMAAPLVTNLMDISSLLVYFVCAKLILGL
ncbi:MAG: magnesium transporter [Erysipelothrix sp.]|nr:magnesium transporter [Erysipelothrix sp.]